MEPDIETQQRCLQVPAEEILRGCDSLQGLRAALSEAQLSPEARQRMDLGQGVSEEGRTAEEASTWLRQCPSADDAAAQAAELEATCAATMATQDAAAAMGDFQLAARGAHAVFTSALLSVYQSLVATLGERRDAPGTSDEERLALDAEIGAITLPFVDEEERAVESQRRADRLVSAAQAEAEEATARAQAEVEHLSAVRALQRGEDAPAAALKRPRERAEEAPKTPRKGRGRRSSNRR